MRRHREQDGDEVLRRSLSHAVLVFGLLVTALVAALQQSNAVDGRDLMFDAASTRIQEDLVDAVDSRVLDFRSGVNFIAATHPGPLAQYQDFFTRDFEAVMANDPGVLFLELIPDDGTDALLARERSLGNDDFTLTLLPTAADHRVVVTRLARYARVFDLPLLGLDVTTLRRQLLPDDVGDDGFELYIGRTDDLVAFVNPGNTQDAAYDDYENYVAFLIGSVADDDGALIGYAVYFQTVDGLLDGVTDRDLRGLSVRLYVDGIDEPVAGRLSPDAPAIEDADLKAIREVTTASLRWRTEVWADNDFGPATGLFDQIWVWISGILVTVAAYAASIRRQRNRKSLDTARFELAHAMTLAQTDTLTGLLNRDGLVEAARQFAIDAAATVFFIDLDGFKAVNDSGGHEHGDQVLRTVAAELRNIFRTDDLVSRLGGDEFVVFTQHGGSSDYVQAVSTRINGAISTIDARVTCSLGVASRPDGEPVDVKDLIRTADGAMYEAKRSGGDRFSIGARAVNGSGSGATDGVGATEQA